MAEPAIKLSDQLLIVGKNGQGKSVLAEHLFHRIRTQKVCVNVKADPKLSYRLRTMYAEEALSHVIGRPDRIDFDKPVIEYIPRSVDDSQEFDDLYRRFVSRSNMTVWLDEAYGPTTANRVPTSMGRYLQHGRARNLRHIACTQRPVHIARPLVTEAHHLILFPRGFNAKDRRTVGDEMGLSGEQMDRYARQLRQVEAYGEFGHAWYEQRADTLHLRPSVPVS